jgi:Glycine/sarcosine/betaine reductase selenoprotein B (GRDB).
MEIIESLPEFKRKFANWSGSETLGGYPFIKNTHTPFTPVRRALPMMNLALISSAGAYIDGMEPFDLSSKDGDTEFREFPIEVEAADMRYSAKGFDTKAVLEDRNSQIPIDRLLEYEANGVIGKLNNVWFSLSPWIPNAARVAEEMAPRIAERLQRYEVQAALLIPASRLCHQTLGVLARGIEAAGLPTMVISVAKMPPNSSVLRERITTPAISAPSQAGRTGANINSGSSMNRSALWKLSTSPAHAS